MRLLLRNHQSPGDVLMMTAAVRDLHRAHPARFTTAVETSCQPLWENNPWVVPAYTLGRPDRVVECGYPLVHESNRRPLHFIHGFALDLERQLDIPIPVTEFRGDVHLSPKELTEPSPVQMAGYPGRYWVVVSGGKLDLTTKWWPPEYFQAVIDHFAGRIQFVQCGAGGSDHHPPLRRVLSLCGRTGIREFLRVMHRADGVLCPVTFAMHLAAAVPTAAGNLPLRPCVVVAGGREPTHWEAYPHHQYLHTIGVLDCCATGGCWRSRCQPLGDGDRNDLSLCARPRRISDDAAMTPHCMALITPQRVIDAIELYLSRSHRVPPRVAIQPARLFPSPSSRARTAAEDAKISVRPNGVAVTIGTGAFEPMARLAAREVRARTGLETVVIGADALAASGLSHPSLLKFRIFDLVRADNVLYFDADMVCLEDWDPTPYFGGEAIVAVRDRMFDSIRQEASTWGVPADEYFNAGMFIASATHHREWLRLAESLYPRAGLPLLDQSPLNAARHRLGIPIRLLDRRHNWLGFGGNSLSLDVPVVMAHKLVPHRVEVNVDYMEGRYDLFRPTIVMEDSEAARLAGRSFVLSGTNGADDRTVCFREDGTILPAADVDDAGYWFVHLREQRPTLALASEHAILHQLVEQLGGAWSSVGADGLRLVDESIYREPPLTVETARPTANRFVRGIAPYPAERFRGRGIVICGGGEKYLPCAWVCIRMLRQVGCELPIELWQLRGTERDERIAAGLAELDVRCVNAAEVRCEHAARYLGGWELKPYAILHSAFEHVLYLDADNVPVADPSYLFDAPAFAKAGAVFWPDYGRLAPFAEIWQICGVRYRDEPEFESGQILVDKRRCWEALRLTMHLNEHSDFYYRYLHGDKDTFHMAWRMLGQNYAMVPHPIQRLHGTMCQHDFDGRRLFQHRNIPKWNVRGTNPHVEGFALEEDCLRFLREFSELLR